MILLEQVLKKCFRKMKIVVLAIILNIRTAGITIGFNRINNIRVDYSIASVLSFRRTILDSGNTYVAEDKFQILKINSIA